jgi:hypothetical protein
MCVILVFWLLHFIWGIRLLFPKCTLTPIDQQERKTYDFDGDETKTGSARLVVYVGVM